MKKLLCLAALALVALLARTTFAEGTLDIYWIDVEGGAATLIVTPAGETVLIDTGNPGRRDPDRIVQVLTKEAGKRQIDHLIVTHYHRDHYGGAETLATMLPIKAMYDNGMFEGMPDNPGKAYFELKCERRVVINPGDKLPLKQAEGQAALPIQLACLGTRQSFIDAPQDAAENSVCADGREKDRDGSDNANSVVTLLDCGPFRFLDAGDLTWNQETKLVCPKNLIGEVDVYQVTHHGLDSSNNPLLVRTVKPAVAVMNNGSTKGCLPEVYETLTSTKSIEAIYQVHKNLRPDGKVNNVADEFIANHEAECKGNFIKLSVAADGKSYTVGIPASGHSKTYQTKAKESAAR
jgi:beta-lactamase superfamily II metal-dependent hydrolase